MGIVKTIKKYGVDNFTFEVLLSGISIEEIDQYEIDYIKKYESHVSTGKGYNVSFGEDVLLKIILILVLTTEKLV